MTHAKSHNRPLEPMPSKGKGKGVVGQTIQPCFSSFAKGFLLG